MVIFAFLDDRYQLFTPMDGNSVRKIFFAAWMTAVLSTQWSFASFAQTQTLVKSAFECWPNSQSPTIACPDQFKTWMIQGTLPKVALTGNQKIDRYITFANRLSMQLQRSMKATKTYDWDVHPHDAGPYSIDTDSIFSEPNYSYSMDFSQSFMEPRTQNFIYAYETTITYWNGITEVEIDQNWDVSSDWSLRLFNTSLVISQVNSKTFSIWQTETTSKGASGPIQSKTVPLPNDGPIDLSANINSPERLRLLKQGHTFYLPGDYELPLKKVDNIKIANNEIFDPTLGHKVVSTGFDVVIVANDIHLPVSRNFSLKSPFWETTTVGSSTWYLPENFWFKGIPPQPNFESDDDGSVRYKSGTNPQDVPTSIIVRSPVRLSGYDHMGLYWKTAPTNFTSASDINDGSYKFQYHFEGSGEFHLSNYENFERWIAPTNAPYVHGSSTVQIDLPYIMKLDRKILQKVGASASNAEIAAEIITILDNRFEYNFRSEDVGGHVRYMSTSDIIKQKYITCSNYSTLFAAVARSFGIPTRIIVGNAIGKNSLGGHAWNEIEVAPHIWVPIDATAGFPVFFTGNYLPVTVLKHDAFTPTIQPKIYKFLTGNISVIVTQTEPEVL